MNISENVMDTIFEEAAQNKELFEQYLLESENLDGFSEIEIDIAVNEFMQDFEDSKIPIEDFIDNSIEEGVLGTILGGLGGFALGKSVGKVIAKVLGITKGIFYNLLTSRLVGAAIGAAIGYRVSKNKK